MADLNQNKNQNPFAIQADRHGKLDGFSYRLEWTEENFSRGGGKELIGRTFNFSKLRWFSIALGLFLFLLFFRAFWLQIIRHDYYYSLAEGNRVREDRLEAKRGIIYDVNMKPLVKNVANFVLYSIPADLPEKSEERNKIFFQISNVLGGEYTPEKIAGIVEPVIRGSLESYQPLFIADNIDYNQAMLLNLESDRIPGFLITNKTRREYDLTSQSLSHVLGYTGKINPEELKIYGEEYQQIDYIGKSGLEDFYENELKGEGGVKKIEVDALGREKKIISTTAPKDGHNLQLSLDGGLQKKIEETTQKYLARAGAKRASVVALNPQNGEILALVSLPAYNDNLFAKGIKTEEYNQLLNDPDRPLFNRAVSGEFPSGSTIKPVMAVAALEEKIITETTAFLSNGGLRIGQWFFPDWKAGGHGMTNVKKAIAESVNTFFYIIGGGYQDFVGLGVDRIVKYEKMFGLGEQTGIDLPNEASGFLPSKDWKEKVKGERWYIGDTYHLAIGQGDIIVTPLQVANYTVFFANGGTLYRPHLAKKILDGKDQEISEVKPEAVKTNFIDPKNIEIVREGMRQTITDGSARSLQVVPVPVAGKTGTAQWATDKKNHAWFTGFAPYDKPEIVITVLIEEGDEGSTTAVPITKEVLQWYFGGRPENSEN